MSDRLKKAALCRPRPGDAGTGVGSPRPIGVGGEVAARPCRSSTWPVARRSGLLRRGPHVRRANRTLPAPFAGGGLVQGGGSALVAFRHVRLAPMLLLIAHPDDGQSMGNEI